MWSGSLLAGCRSRLPCRKPSWPGLPSAELTIHCLASARAWNLSCDTYLSVSTPIQLATAELLDRGAVVRRQIQERVRSNYQALGARASEVPSCELLKADGGWYAVITRTIDHV